MIHYLSLAAALLAVACLGWALESDAKEPAKKPAGLAAAEPASEAPSNDARVTVTLGEGERDLLLSGMRTYLESVQGIVAALAENESDRVPELARRSGAKLLQDISPLTALKMPAGFTAMSLDTHGKFDTLAERAEGAASRSEILSELRDILANCTSCHVTYRVVQKR